MTKDTSSVTSPPEYSIAPSSSPGSPWRVRFHVQRRRPRDQRRNYKTRCEAWNKSEIRDFASGHLVGHDRRGARRFRCDGRLSASRISNSQPSMISSDNSFSFADVLGKCVASTLPTSLIASVSAWVNFSFIKWTRIPSTTRCQNCSPHFS